MLKSENWEWESQKYSKKVNGLNLIFKIIIINLKILLYLYNYNILMQLTEFMKTKSTKIFLYPH